MEHLAHILLQDAQVILAILNNIFGPTIAFAQESAGKVGAERLGDFKPISAGFEQLIGITGGEGINASGDFGQFVNSLYKLSIRIAGAVAVGMFVWGGIMYMTQPFGVSEGGVGEAKARMQNAVIGLLMLLATWVIFNQINPDILNLKINASPLKPLEAQKNTTSTDSSDTARTTESTPEEARAGIVHTIDNTGKERTCTVSHFSGEETCN
jgi:hypothetical protein